MWSSSVSKRGAGISGCRFRKPFRSDDMTKVAAVILAGNAAEVERQSRIALGKGADLVELRLDAIADLGPGTIRHLAKSLGEHTIATMRSSGQGGAQRKGRGSGRRPRHRDSPDRPRADEDRSGSSDHPDRDRHRGDGYPCTRRLT